MSDRPHVLVLEDETLIAVDLQDILEDQGFRPTLHFRWDKADQWLRENTPDVAIMDVLLHGESCVDLAKTLADRNVPFLVHTVWARNEGLDPIFTDALWLEKPAAYRDLLHRLHQLLRIAAH